MSTTRPYINMLKEFSSAKLLHAYTSYLVIMVDAVTFAINPKQEPTHIHYRYGFCHAAEKLKVVPRITALLINLHTQTGCNTYPISGGVYNSWEPFDKWKGQYGKQRRLFVSDCIQTVKTILIERGYNL